MRKRSAVEPSSEPNESGHKGFTPTDGPADPAPYVSSFLPDEKEKELSADFQRIIETVFLDNPLEVYQRLEAQLKIGDQRTDYGTVQKALDEAESNARAAHKLWQTAKIARITWESDNKNIFAAIREEATLMLEREKDQGLRKKMITEADVDLMGAKLHPDEYRHQEIKRAKVKSMEDSMQQLCELWLKRVSSVQTMLSKLR